MENVESPTKSAANRTIERNVLKEFNNINTATKSPKELASTDQPRALAKVPTNLTVTESLVLNRNHLNGTTRNDDGPADTMNESSPAHFQSESFETVSHEPLNVTQTLLAGLSPCPQNTTFSATKITAANQTVLIESDLKMDGDTDEEYGIVNTERMNQTRNVDTFKSYLALCADSIELENETHDAAQNSWKMEVDEDESSTTTITTPPDQRLSTVTAEQIFSSRKAPTFSEMFPNSTHSTNDEFEKCSTNNRWDASLDVEKTDSSDEISPDKQPITNLTMELDVKDTADDGSVTPSFEFKQPSGPCSIAGKTNKLKDTGSSLVLNSNDFEFLQSRGANSPIPDDDPRNSLLLRFHPLAARRSLKSAQLKPIVDPVGDPTDPNKTLTLSSDRKISLGDCVTEKQLSNVGLVEIGNDMDNDANNGYMNNVRIDKNGDKVISVDGVLITNKKIDISSADDSIRKKMEEYEATQDILLKQITEKDKAITKTSNVLELYEKAIAEALAAKEKLSQNYEKEHEELKADRDVTHQHLLSLESTFADLHMKFERNVQYTSQLQEKLNALTEDKSKAEDLLRQQELRYDKMKSHTMQQFDIANAKLEQQTRTISLDNTKLKAQIKREEIHKNAVAEELLQKNEELAKICDELISDQRN